MIGSQEWRNNVFTYPIAVLSTRCGITAPGRSAGNVHRYRIMDDTESCYSVGGQLLDSRARAAAVSYTADVDGSLL